MLVDPERIRLMALATHAVADDVRTGQRRVLAAADVRWVSPAAERYRARLTDAFGAALECARELERAGDLLAVHARAVAEQQALVASRLLAMEEGMAGLASVGIAVGRAGAELAHHLVLP